MSKLTTHLRSCILSNIMEKSPAKTAQLEADRKLRLAGDALFEAAIGKKNIELMAQLPSGYLVETDCVGLEFGTQTMAVRLSTTRRVPRGAEHRYDGFGTSLKVDHPLVRAYGEIMDEFESACAKTNKLREELRATLASFSTLKALIKAWPEIESAIPSQAKVGPSKNLPSHLPALTVALGLPIPAEVA